MRARIMIETRVKKVFYSASANRHYFTRIAAVKAEARMLIMRKHPTESSEDNTGYPDGIGANCIAAISCTDAWCGWSETR